MVLRLNCPAVSGPTRRGIPPSPRDRPRRVTLHGGAIRTYFTSLFFESLTASFLYSTSHLEQAPSEQAIFCFPLTYPVLDSLNFVQ
jgi:hypothetical protein